MFSLRCSKQNFPRHNHLPEVLLFMKAMCVLRSSCSTNHYQRVAHQLHSNNSTNSYHSYNNSMARCLNLLLTNLEYDAVEQQILKKNKDTRGCTFSAYLVALLIILTKSGFNDAPPTKKPLMSGIVYSSSQLSVVTEPP